MHIVISGGTGLIGQALAANLLKDGHKVTILTRNAHRNPPLRGSELQQWDGRSPDGWGHLIDTADALVNLAGENLAGDGVLPRRWSNEQKQRILSSRLHAGIALSQAIMAAGRPPRVLIQASGIGYYGPLADEIVSEDNLPGHDFLARLAVEWEASTSDIEQRGVRRAVIRTGAVLSAQGGALPRLIMPYRFLVGGPLGSGRQYLSWIHIADEIGAIRFLIDNENAKGAFNLVAPNPVSNAIFGKIVGQVLHRPSFFPTPNWVMKMLLGEVSTLVLDGQRAYPRRLQELGYTFKFPEPEAALHDLLS